MGAVIATTRRSPLTSSRERNSMRADNVGDREVAGLEAAVNQISLAVSMTQSAG